MSRTRHAFARALLSPGAAVPAGLKGRDAANREMRFSVYRNNVICGLIDALADTFPVTLALVGESFFRGMARERVLADPPRGPILTAYADTFPDFIAAFRHASSVPFLADVARIEALGVRAYHAADAEPVAASTYEALALQPEHLAAAVVELHPSVYWMQSPHAAWSIWNAHQCVDEFSQADLSALNLHQPQDVLVARPRLEVHTSLLPPGGSAFLDALHAGRCMGDAFAAAVTTDATTDPAALFQIMIEYGLATDLKFQEET